MGELTVRSWEFKGKAFLNTSSLETILELSHTIYLFIYFFFGSLLFLQDTVQHDLLLQ